jgi:hypothetical protein
VGHTRDRIDRGTTQKTETGKATLIGSRATTRVLSWVKRSVETKPSPH